MAWADVEDAIWDWVSAGSGLGEENVLWANQDGAQASSRPFVTVRIGDLLALGAVDEYVEVDHTEDAVAPAAGEEIEQVVRGQREFTVSVQVFSASKVEAGTARALASRIQTALALPSVRLALNNAGLSPFDAGRVREVSAVLDADFEARALLEVRFYVVEQLSEFTTYISDVEVTDESPTPDETFLLHISGNRISPAAAGATASGGTPVVT